MPRVTRSSQRCIDLIKHFDTPVLKAYVCSANVPAIGYGSIVYPDGQDVKPGDVCTLHQAGLYLQNDLLYFEKIVSVYTREDISQQQFDALVCFSYHVGPANFKNSILLKVVNNDPFAYDQIKAQFLSWNKGGKDLKYLSRQRAAEFYLYKREPVFAV